MDSSRQPAQVFPWLADLWTVDVTENPQPGTHWCPHPDCCSLPCDMAFCPHGQNFINVITLNVTYMEQIKCALYIPRPCALLCVITTQLFAAVSFLSVCREEPLIWKYFIFCCVVDIMCHSTNRLWFILDIGRHKK